MKKNTKEQSLENANLVKKYVMRLYKEFKAFINKGSVVDLAVGLMIGSAFTAIVSSLVNNILKPLINWIPGIDGTGALQTVLRNAVTDAEGNVITEALIIDWGAVISAIITFFLTALVTFILVKLFARLKEAGQKIKDTAKDVAEKAIDEIKKEANHKDKVSKQDISDADNIDLSQKDDQSHSPTNDVYRSDSEENNNAEEAGTSANNAPVNPNESIEDLLKQIIALLEKQPLE